MALTDTFVKNTKHKGSTTGEKYADGGGMYLLVKAPGKYWRMDYRFADKRKTLALGVYPEVSLATARSRRDKAREHLADGTDPIAAKSNKKAAQATAAANTFEGIAREWHSTKSSGWSKTHTETTMERMEKNLFPWLGAKPITSITPPQVLETLRRIEQRGAIDTTHRVKAITNSVFMFAIATGRAIFNPAASMGEALKTTVKGHHPAIVEPQRFGQLLRDIHTYTGSNITRAALQIHALTYQRANEIRDMQWSEVDLESGLWTIPAARMKGVLEKKAHGAPHLIPLSSQAIAVLTDLKPLTGHGKKVFPSERGEGRSISENTARQALRSMGYLDHVPHGFRASARTLIHEALHYPREVIERQLSHGSDEALGGAYDRTQFMVERGKMMQTWADYLDKLRVGGDVIPPAPGGVEPGYPRSTLLMLQ